MEPKEKFSIRTIGPPPEGTPVARDRRRPPGAERAECTVYLAAWSGSGVLVDPVRRLGVVSQSRGRRYHWVCEHEAHDGRSDRRGLTAWSCFSCRYRYP